MVVHPLEVNPSNSFNVGPFSELDPSGWGLTVKIFKASDGTVLASQSSWTASDNTLVGTLNLNTGAMATAFASASTTEVPGIVEFEFTDANGKITIQGTCTIKREYITSGSPSATPEDTYLTENASIALFVPKSGSAGDGFTLKSADGTKTIFVYCDNDGVLRSDPIS